MWCWQSQFPSNIDVDFDGCDVAADHVAVVDDDHHYEVVVDDDDAIIQLRRKMTWWKLIEVSAIVAVSMRRVAPLFQNQPIDIDQQTIRVQWNGGKFMIIASEMDFNNGRMLSAT